MSDFLKIAVALFSYFFIAPVLGLIASKSRFFEKLIVVAMFSLISLPGHLSGFYVFAVPHVRTWMPGSEVLFICPFALSLVIASFFRSGMRSIHVPIVLSVFWGLFLVWMGISVAMSYYPGLSALAFFRYLQVFIVIVGVNCFIQTETQLVFLLKCVLALLAYIIVRALLDRYVFNVYAFSLILHRNVTGIVCYSLSIFVISAAAVFRADFMSYIAQALAGFGVLATLQTQSRMASVGAAVAGIFSIYQVVNRKHFLSSVVKLGAMALLLSLVVFVQKDETLARFKSYDQNEASDRTREDMHQTSRSVGLQHPIFGVGPNSYTPLINTVIADRVFDKNADFEEMMIEQERGVPECLYDLFFAEMGFPGLILLLLIFLVTLWVPLKAYLQSHGHPLKPLLGGICVILSFQYVHYYHERVWTFAPTLMLWMVIVGVGLAVSRIVGTHSPKGS